MALEQEEILKSWVLSLTIVIALSIVMYSILTWGEYIGFSTNNIEGKIAIMLLSGFHALFTIIFVGNLVEYFNRKPGVLTMVFIIIIETVFLYSLGVYSDSIMFSGSLALVLLALVYSLLAS